MSKLLTLNDPTHCPHCRRNRAVSRDARKCRMCGKRLFFQDDNFWLVANNSILDYFVFFRGKGSWSGWIYQSHLTAPSPLIDNRFVEIKVPKELPQDKRALPSNCSTVPGQLAKEEDFVEA